MASSRLEKIGTIFTRVNGLLKSGAMKWEDRPLWYDIYKAFPPNEEPKYDRPAPDIPVRSIFYEEDKLRALFHKNTKNLGAINMSNSETQTKTMKFIEIYRKLETASESVPKEQLYINAVEMLSRELEQQTFEIQATIGRDSSLVDSFKEAQKQQVPLKIDVSKILKE